MLININMINYTEVTANNDRFMNLTSSKVDVSGVSGRIVPQALFFLSLNILHLEICLIKVKANNKLQGKRPVYQIFTLIMFI